jgi:two-component system, LytTR family, sensor kinase
MLTKSNAMPVVESKRIKEGLKFFFIGGGILTFLSMFTMKNPTASDFLKYGFLNGLTFTVMGSGNGFLADYIDGYLPWTKNAALRLIVSILATIVYTFIAWVFIIWIWVFVTEGQLLSISELINIIPKNKNAYFFSQTITFMVSAFMHGRSFLIGWRTSLLEAEKLKKDHIAAQYETLKNQVNPHFLFNSFNVLTTLVHKDADLAEQFVRQLSNVYRYVLDSRDKEVVPLELELKQLEAYIFLMKIRFGESLKADIKPMPVLARKEATKGVSVAPLTLQMLFENALKHNAVSKNTPLSIEVFQEGTDYIVVKNLIQLKNSVGESTGVGLENICSRYKFLSAKAVIILQEGGFFMVKIPIIH